MDVAKKQKGHGDTSSDTAVSLKKGDFITPSVNPFFQKENGGLISFQTAVLRRNTLADNNGLVVWCQRTSAQKLSKKSR